jgi:hypothetical protein
MTIWRHDDILIYVLFNGHNTFLKKAHIWTDYGDRLFSLYKEIIIIITFPKS